MHALACEIHVMDVTCQPQGEVKVNWKFRRNANLDQGTWLGRVMAIHIVHGRPRMHEDREWRHRPNRAEDNDNLSRPPVRCERERLASRLGKKSDTHQHKEVMWQLIGVGRFRWFVTQNHSAGRFSGLILRTGANSMCLGVQDGGHVASSRSLLGGRGKIWRWHVL